jgi:murein DD-endopeptidase MepM/ murein hydrolase activator NlpD
MPQEGSRRRKKPHQYDVMIVPQGEGAKPVSFRASRAKIAAFTILAFLLSVCITLAILIFTPVAMYVPIPNPGLEERYGRQISDMQRELATLTQDFMLVKDYNQQMRKALGEGAAGDSSTTAKTPLMTTVEGRASYDEKPATTTPPANARQEPQETLDAPSMDETEGGYDPTVVTVGETSPSSFPLLSPVVGFVSQGFDPEHNHYGIDFAGKRGTPIYAAGDGHVIFAGWTYDDGNMLIISHGGGYLTVYKHNQSLLTTPQSAVTRGQPIALLGTSGKTSLGPHLHFEVWKDGLPRDPNKFLLTPSKVGS